MAFLRRITTKLCFKCQKVHKGWGKYCNEHAHLEGQVTAQPSGELYDQVDKDSKFFVGTQYRAGGGYSDSIDQED